ncbi:hypothetical protein ACFE04_004644 [Oxalis oulophora]
MGEEDTCKECRSWEEELYWAHFQSIRFTQFLRSPIFHHQLPIPEKFVKNLRNKLPETVTLKGPSGVMWNIGITVLDNSVYFKHGWGAFVKKNFLEENDILIFNYNGDSHFDVLMFDGGNFCEKERPYFVRKCGHMKNDCNYQDKGKSTKNPVEVLSPSTGVLGSPVEISSPKSPVEILTPFNGVAFGSPSSSKSPAEVVTSSRGVSGIVAEKSTDNHIDIDTIPVAQLATHPAYKRIRLGSSYASPRNLMHSFNNGGHSNGAEAMDIKPGSSSLLDLQKLNKSGPQYASNRRPVTETERVNTLHLAQAAVPDKGFLIVMKPTHVYRKFYMGIPVGWVKRYMALQNQEITLHCNERVWHTKFYYVEKRGTGGLALGWRHFALENNLEESDVCVFEPTNLPSSPIVLDVYIFRVVEEVVPPTQLGSTSRY